MQFLPSLSDKNRTEMYYFLSEIAFDLKTTNKANDKLLFFLANIFDYIIKCKIIKYRCIILDIHHESRLHFSL